MADSIAMRLSRTNAWWIGGFALLVVAVLAVMFQANWLPPAQAWIAQLMKHGSDAGHAATGTAASHADEHDHAHAGHSSANSLNSLELSPQARKSINLATGKVELRNFQRTISVPGVVTERPGRSVIEITAPMTGVVTRIGAIQGEAVSPGQLLFELRLTHEELVQAQSEFLRTAEDLDVIAREVDRLERATSSGAIAGKTLLERQYERQKQQGVLRAQHQALLLHGLTEEQVSGILSTRKLLKVLSVTVPLDDGAPSMAGPAVYQVQRMRIDKGQHVTAGDELAELTNHAELFVEGNAFEKDTPLIHRALEQDAELTAVLEAADAESVHVPGLKILYVSGQVDAATRSLHFYVTLPNELLRDRRTDEHRFISWRYKPGQRMQLLVPVEQWKDCIVLPAVAVAQDGLETYVFQANGDRFERRPVQVEHRDPHWVVIANDGSLFPGDVVAMSAAQQMLLAIKNKGGGGIDPHAGHSH